ncbi:MAG TPA: type II toxin-antitoxin system PemK/MazF family toxin [Jatrophihabitans sp.]|nr:type II toxin-antitoxin system PemK/MazF family toxin [Jatrophihabitans sp.]
MTIVPVTSNVSRLFRLQTLLAADLTGLPVDSHAQAEQIRSVTVERIGRLIGRVPVQLMPALDNAMRLHLQL